MIILATSAALIGLIHSLAPGHWLPVVLMAKGKRWSLHQALAGALAASTGHILVSVLLGWVGLFLGSQISASRHEEFEHYAALSLIGCGLLYALYSWNSHSRCRGHEHHGPSPKKREKAPYLFLFMVGFSPCVAVLPVFGAAAIQNAVTLLMTQLGFALGVLVAINGATLAGVKGLGKLDHPIFEHYGDVLTGLALALLGVVLLLLPH